MAIKIRKVTTGIMPLVEVEGYDVYTAAKDRIRHMYDRFDNVVVSFSGGKDSTCVLHLTHEVAKEIDRLPVHVTFWDEEAIPYETEDYVRRVINHFGDEIIMDWYCVPIKHRNGCSEEAPYWYPWNPNEKDLWVRPLPPEAITIDDLDWISEDPKTWAELPTYASIYQFGFEKWGNLCNVLGIRAQESPTRAKAVARRKEENYIVASTSAFTGKLKTNNVWKGYPIYDWRTEDVWTAPQRFGWDYNSGYDAMNMAGISGINQRIAPPFGEQPMRNLWMFAKCFPDVWDKMVDRVPGANTAGLYSKTGISLYGFSASGSSTVEKAGDMTWKEFAFQMIDEIDDQTIKQHVAERVQGLISVHYKKTDEPILYNSPHYYTGLSWKDLIKIIIRKDTKNRISTDSVSVGTPEFDKRKTAYYKELDGEE